MPSSAISLEIGGELPLCVGRLTMFLAPKFPRVNDDVIMTSFIILISAFPKPYVIDETL